MHPRSKQWHIIDFVITCQKDSKDGLTTRAMRGADCWTDHHLVRAKLNICIIPHHHKRPKIIRQAFNITRLNTRQQEFQDQLDLRLEAAGPLTDGPEEKWTKFKDAVNESAKTVLGPKKRHHQDWFGENNEAIQKPLTEKRAAYIDWQNHPNCVARRDKFKEHQARAQCELRAMQDAWWEEKAEEIQRYTDTQRTKQLYDAIKTIYGPSRRGQLPCSLQMVPPSSKTKKVSVQDGKNISASSSTGHL